MPRARCEGLPERVEDCLDARRPFARRAYRDPENPDNEFKLTVSELAVYFGNILLKELGGSWRYARMPNFFESLVQIDDLEIFVFQALIKKCSRDFGHEKLFEKYSAFQEIVEKRRAGYGRPH